MGRYDKRTLPTNLTPVGTRCIRLDIPDDDEWERQAFSQLTELAIWSFWKRDPGKNGKPVADKWRDALLTWGRCEPPMTIEFRQDDCGLYFTTDGWETETQIYDGLQCLLSDGGRQVIQDWAGDLIDQMIEDGTLQGGTGGQSPETAPLPGSCRTFHVALTANSQWICPIAVTANDSIHITNVRGGWTDGTPAWWCGDGARYLIGTCNEAMKTHVAGDPLNPGAYHMALVGHLVDTGTWFDPLTALYTVAAGVPDQLFTVQANDASLGDNGGEVNFDVEVCKGGWVHEFDFRLGQYGWTAFRGSEGQDRALYVAGQGWTKNSTRFPGLVQFQSAVKNTTLVAATFYWSTLANGPTHNIELGFAESFGIFSGTQTVLETTMTHAPMTHNDKFFVNFANDSAQYGTAYTGYVYKIILYGRGPDPF